MRIISIDPGYERVGIAILEKNKGDKKESYVFSECFKTSAKLPLEDRLYHIGQRVEEVIQEFQPHKMAIENLFFTSNQKTVMGVSQARGVIMYEAKRGDLEIMEFTPLQIKNATTGYGKATKNQVFTMVHQLISLPENVKQDDEVDAIAVGLTAFAYIRL